jgi:ABC-type transporter Mla maintaining outer membrane lipid asymmetry ATPase subunit MlaF
MANFCFDPQSKKILRDGAAATPMRATTHFLVLREGKIYFEGTPDELMKSRDPYLRRFLI